MAVTYQRNQGIKKNSELLFYLTLLTGLFFLIEISYFIEISDFYLGDVRNLASHISLPFKVVPPVLLFVLTQLAVHFLFTIIVWLEAVFIGYAANYSIKKTENIGFILWGLNLVAIIFANQYYFPNSRFAALTEAFVNHAIAGDFLFILSLILLVAVIVAIWGAFKTYPKMFATIVSAITVCALSVIGFKHFTYQVPKDDANRHQPNIILIGLDSLRPDYLGYFGYEKQTPHLDKFLNQATVFADALTPLARTFPAWVSILTGQYPKQNGIRTNLQDQGHLDLHATLPAILKRYGYKTIFATDETRFSNVDQGFGFDEVITPSMGFNDFLLGTLNDFPFSNLLVNTPIGRIIFPYSYGNRPAAVTYSPDSFINLLKPMLAKSRTKPVFLAVHFCMAHHPYLWSSYVVDSRPEKNYQAAVARADQQFGDFVKLLEKNKFLEHSIVVVLSDHGEALELHGDRATDTELFVSKHLKAPPHFYPQTIDTQSIDESAGHGTDVLGLTQYHTVLAFRSFGLEPNQKNIIPGSVSLIDIKPTILNMLGLAFSNNAGKSLRANIFGTQTTVTAQKDFFTESDFSPAAVRTVHPETRDVVFEGINYFKLDPTTMRFTVKDEMKKMIFSSKQFADYYGDWVLALYPQNTTKMMPILVNLKTGEWTNDLHTQLALRSPAQHMLSAMKKFYGQDITQISSSSLSS